MVNGLIFVSLALIIALGIAISSIRHLRERVVREQRAREVLAATVSELENALSLSSQRIADLGGDPVSVLDTDKGGLARG